MTQMALVFAYGCAREDRDRPVCWVVVEAAGPDADSAAALGYARIEPASAVVRAVRSGTKLIVGVDVLSRARAVRVEAPGACPLAVPLSEIPPGATAHRRLVRRLELRAPPHPRDLGYDAPFAIDAILGCPESPGETVTWRQTSGPAVRDVMTGPRGMRFEARTAPPDDAALRRPVRGIVPISPRTSAPITIEAEWHPARAEDAAGGRCTIDLASASRARGLPNVGLDEGVLLAGSGWSVASAPGGATAPLQRTGELTRLIPDVAGTWQLRDDAGHLLSLHAGRYDETPLDCGRSGCHGLIADATQRSPMTNALRRLVGDEAEARGDVACAIACHATGEPGTHDGGFADIMGPRDLGVDWSSLPRAARRLGGVTCLGCHGPGAIPEPSARWAILRVDVCAACHDAPPTYGHVAAWRTSRMARSDADGDARTDPACARCHTTSGFLASVAGRADDRVAPADVAPSGVACAACHAPHDDHGAPGAADADPLLRRMSLPAAFGRLTVASRSGVCIRCHAPVAPAFAEGSSAIAPEASAATIWSGRGGVDPRTGASFEMPAVHGVVDGGCVGCHAAGLSSLERGASHGFQANWAMCAACHAIAPDTRAIDRDIHDRAAALLARLTDVPLPAPTDRPRHARRITLSDDPAGRAAYDVLLVLEDPAAAAHNAPFARELLNMASAVTGGAP
jgi:hypothetical protein